LSMTAGTEVKATRAPKQAEEHELEVWRCFLRAHAAITRQLDSDLTCAHKLTLSQYEVLLHLAKAPEQKMRMSELAKRVLLTRSGVTRLVSGLEEERFVERTSCAADARGAFARLTPSGEAKLREASGTHRKGVEELYLGRFSKHDLEKLSVLLRALPQDRFVD
jgi:DNA-binding MarR family transcriptional regulator